MPLNSRFMEMRKLPLDFYTEYHQFFIHDKDSPINPNNEFWTDRTHKDRLAIIPGSLSVGIGCYGPLKGELVLLDRPPKVTDFSQYDHVVEGSIHCKSGTLEIIPCMSLEPEVSLHVSPGFYRIRIYSTGLDTIKGDEGNDFYFLEIWEEEYSESKVLKNT